ncbi:tol-pal system YbgF family protein [Candidatus Riflebacteria bacterium]
MRSNPPEPEKAIEALNNLILLNPESAIVSDLYEKLIDVHVKYFGDYLKAIELYRKFIDTYPGDEKVEDFILMIAVIYSDYLKDPESSLETLKASVQGIFFAQST